MITELGTGLAGPPGGPAGGAAPRPPRPARDLARRCASSGTRTRCIEDFIADSDTVIGELERNKRDVVRWVREAGDAAEITATRRDELRARLPPLPDLPRRARADDGAPGRAGRRADPAAARPAPRGARSRHVLHPRRSVRRGQPARRALARRGRGEWHARLHASGREEIAELRALAQDAQPLRQAAAPVPPDDRRPPPRRSSTTRAPRPARRRRPTRPPSGAERGFTGIEALWNYFYWQTLSINMLDDTSHMLRASLTITECSPFRNDKPRRRSRPASTFEHCNALPRPQPAGHLQPRPARRRRQPRRRARASAQSGLPRRAARRAARRGPARGRPAARPARPVAAPGDAAARARGPARRPHARAGAARPAHRPRRAQARARGAAASRSRQPPPRRRSATDQLLDFLLAP